MDEESQRSSAAGGDEPLVSSRSEFVSMYKPLTLCAAQFEAVFMLMFFVAIGH